MTKIDPDKVFHGEEVDVRGEWVDPHLLRRLGENIVLRIRSSGVASPHIVLGGDTRDDTLALIDALSRGIVHRGGSIILIGGDIAKPLVYFAAQFYAAHAIAYVTASHVRSSFNGVKACFAEKPALINPRLPLAAKEVVNRRDEVIAEYERYLLTTFGQGLGSGTPLVADTLHGASWLVAPMVLKKFKFDLECIHNYIDRKFTHLDNNAPDPTLPHNLKELQSVVKIWGGIGAAFDGDMDRVVFVDEQGEVVPADEIAMVIASHIIKSSPGKPKVVYHCLSTNALPEIIEKSGGQPIVQETGWLSIKEKMKQAGAVFGSEISGHFFYSRPLYYINNGDDGLYTTLMLSKVLKESGQTLAEFRKQLPAYFTSPELRVIYSEKRNHAIIDALKKRFQADPSFALNVIGNDLRAEKRDENGWCSWVVFRVSRTEPDKLSFRFEGRTLKHLAEIKSTLLNSIPDHAQDVREKLEQSYKSLVSDPAAYYHRALQAAGRLP